MKLAFWLMSSNHIACEIGKRVGYDAVVIDHEHGAFGVVDLDRIVPVCTAIGLTTYVRVSSPQRPPIQSALDFGADGVIIPQIEDVEHARAVTAFAKYPPLGTRGMGYSRTQNYEGVDDSFVGDENKRTQCYAMIETPTALADAERIAALDTVDGLFAGPSDLALTRGRGQNRWGDQDIADIRRIAEAARDHGKLFATTGAELPAASAFGCEVGASFMTAGADDAAIYAGLEQVLDTARQNLENNKQ